MPHTLSTAALQAIYAQETGEAFIVLLTLSHPSLPAPIRVCSDGQDFTSRGNVFTAYPFQLSLPDDREDQLPEATVTIDNIDRAITAAIRQLLTPPTLLIEIVTASEPDTVEETFSLWMRNIQYDALTISGKLAFEEILAEPFPGDLCTPSILPGAFEVY